MQSGDRMIHTREHKKSVKTGSFLEQQLQQTQHEKQILLEQLAKFEVPVCFGCSSRLPTLEKQLHNKTKQKLAKLHELRAQCVRTKDEYKCELNKLKQLEADLKNVASQSERVQCKIDTKNVNIKFLKEAIEQLQCDENSMMEIQRKESERLRDLKKQIENIQDKNIVYELKQENEYILKERNKLKTDLEMFRKERNELEEELFAIAEYTKLKDEELQKRKKSLDGIRENCNNIRKELHEVEAEHECLQTQWNEAKRVSNNFKLDMDRMQSESQEYEMQLAVARKNKENCEVQRCKIRRELHELDAGTQLLRNSLKDYQNQRRIVDQQLKQFEIDMTKANTQLEKRKHSLQCITMQIQELETERKNSCKLHDNLRTKYRQDFVTDRMKLIELRAEKEKLDMELKHFTCPALREKREIINAEKRKIVSADKEIVSVKANIQRTNESLQELKNFLVDLEIEEKEVKRNAHKKQEEINRLRMKVKNSQSEIQSMEKIIKTKEYSDNKQLSFACSERVSALMENISEQFLNDELNTYTDDKVISATALSELKQCFVKYLEENCYKLGLRSMSENDNDLIKGQQLTNTNQEKRALQQESRERKLEVDVMRKELETIKLEQSNLEQTIPEIKSRIAELNSEEESLRRELEKNEQIVDEAKQKNSNIMEDVLAQNKMLERLLEEKNDLNNTLVKAEIEVNELRDMLCRTEEKIKTAKIYVDNKSKDLQNVELDGQNLEFQIVAQRKKNTEMITMYNQERLEMRDNLQNHRIHSSLTELANLAKEGRQNLLYPRFDTATSSDTTELPSLDWQHRLSPEDLNQ